jgi:hypothetical protein
VQLPDHRPTQAAAHAQRLISLVIYDPRTLAVPSGGWPRALAEIAATFVLQLVLFQLAEEIGFTGFLQHPWQDWNHPMKLTFYVALCGRYGIGHCPTAWQEPERSVALSAPVGKA